jgi:hypothetical protein
MDMAGSVALPTEIENSKIAAMRDLTKGKHLTGTG